MCFWLFSASPRIAGFSLASDALSNNTWSVPPPTAFQGGPAGGWWSAASHFHPSNDTVSPVWSGAVLFTAHGADGGANWTFAVRPAFTAGGWDVQLDLPAGPKHDGFDAVPAAAFTPALVTAFEIFDKAASARGSAALPVGGEGSVRRRFEAAGSRREPRA
jgi:hypothetical protein